MSSLDLSNPIESTSGEPVDVSSVLQVDQERRKAISVFKELPVEFDLGLLAVYDPNPIQDEEYEADREQSLIMNARDGIQLLVNQIWSRPTRIVDDGVVAELPPISTPLPREKPLPKAAPMTKWQAFATAKGIAPKPRRDRLIFDEEKQDWVPKYGYKGKNKEIENQWIVEVPADKDPNFDPVNASKEDRKARKLKNESQRLKNLQRAAANDAAASSSKPKQPTAASNAAARAKRMEVLDRDLRVTKTSTASMGKFDKTGDGEKKEKHVKRKFEANEVSTTNERSKAMDILTKIGATPSNKRTKVSDDAPDAGKSDDIINSRKAIKTLTGGRGALSMEGKRGGRGGSRGGSRGGRGGRGRGK